MPKIFGYKIFGSGICGTVFRLRCPRCHIGKLFWSWLKLRRTCHSCRLPLHKLDAQDGPAAFSILIISIINIPLAILLESFLQPPLWLLALIFAILLPLQAFAILRPIKAFFIACAYRFNVRNDS